MKTFVYDDACQPCTRAARVLRQRLGLEQHRPGDDAGRERPVPSEEVEVLPFSQVRDQLTAGQVRMFSQAALLLDDAPAPGEPQELWGAEAIAGVLRLSPRRADRAAARAILSRLGAAPAGWVYGKVAADRAILTKALDLLGVRP